MKRWISLALSLLMLLTLAPTALAAETKPVPPAWVKAEEYAVFEGDSTYTGETWEAVLRLRNDAAAGNLEPQSGDLYTDWNIGEKTDAPASLQFELGLIGMKYAENSGSQRQATRTRRYFGLAKDSWLDEGGSRTDKTYYLFTLWYQRARLLECRPGTSQVFSGLQLEEVVKGSGDTMDQFRDCSARKVVTEAEWAAIDTRTAQEKAEAEIAKTRANVTLDGNRVDTEDLARVVNGRTMIPARYVSELFGQSIQWVAESRTAAVTENKALAGNTNLEPWAMAMGAYLNAVNNGGRPTVFGSKERGLSYGMDAIGKPSAVGTVYTYEWARYILEDSWGITGREELIQTVCRMTYYGHNADFQADVAMIEGMSAAEYREVLKNAEGMDAYMFPYTKRLGQKWGGRGILCWDLFRMSNLVQWGYVAGYLTYPEALALLEPAATLVQKNFKSWDEAFENYLDGYNWWAREDVGTKDPWTVTRGPYVKKLMQNYGELFDDSLFKSPIKGVPGVTAERLLASVQ